MNKELFTNFPPLAPQKRVAKAVGVDPRTLRKAVDSGTIRVVRVGNRDLVVMADFLRKIGVDF